MGGSFIHQTIRNVLSDRRRHAHPLQVTAFDTQAIAKRCRSEGPFSRAALNDEEEQLLRNMMRRVETLADIAAEVGNSGQCLAAGSLKGQLAAGS